MIGQCMAGRTKGRIAAGEEAGMRLRRRSGGGCKDLGMAGSLE